MEQNEFDRMINGISADDGPIRQVTIPEEAIAELTREQADELVARYGSSTLLTLPASEQRFFRWLRENDPSVWSDLWGDDEEYLVSIGYLPELLPKRRGFLICDLVEQQNFFFTEQSITPEDGKIFLDAALDIVHQNGQLTMEQAFVIEAWRAPIDQWRFAFNYRVPLEQTKAMVLWLISEGILLLPPEEQDTPPAADGEMTASGDSDNDWEQDNENGDE
jgi:hypothetical protein